MGRTFTIRDALDLPIVTELAVDHGGQGVAYLLRRAGLDTSTFDYQVWWAAPGDQPRQITRTLALRRDLRFSPDGRRLAYISAESGAPQVWCVPLEGGDQYPVTDAPRGVRHYAWLPSGAAILYIADCRAAGDQRATRHQRDDSYEHLGDREACAFQRVTLDGGAIEELYVGDPGIADFAVSPNGARIAFVSNETGLVEDDHRFDLYVLDIGAGVTRRLTAGSGGAREPCWSPSGVKIAYQARQDPNHTFSQTDLFVIDAAGGVPHNLTRGHIGDVQQHAWLSEGGLLATMAVGSANVITRVSAWEVEPLVDGWRFSFAASAERLAYLTEGPAELPEVVLRALPTGVDTPLTTYSAALEQFDLPETHVVRWPGANDETIEGLLTLPPGGTAGLLPLIVAPHGGPHIRSHNALHPFQHLRYAALAARGYAVLRPNYHGSSGYGNAFAIALYQQIGDLDYRDIMAGIDALIERRIADADRLGIMGSSYGGYLTNWSIGQSGRFKAAVSINGIWDLIGDYGNTEEDLWQIDYCGCAYWEDPDAYRRRSPSSYVQHITTPVLLLHGDADRNVPINNAQEMWHALYHLGRTVRFVRYPREGHDEPEPLHQIDQAERILAWFDQHLCGRG